jgi:hypothetical protein
MIAHLLTSSVARFLDALTSDFVRSVVVSLFRLIRPFFRTCFPILFLNMVSSQPDNQNHCHHPYANSRLVAMTTTEEFDDDAFGKHFPTGTLAFEHWETDRLKTRTTTTDRNIGMTELLTTVERLPSHLDVDFASETLDCESSSCVSISSQSEQIQSTTPTTIIKSTATTSIATQDTFRKWKTRKGSNKHDNKSGFFETIEQEAISCIQQGIHYKILSQAPTMYSLLRAWIVGESNSWPYRYYFLPRRNSLVDYAARVRSSTSLNRSFMQETNCRHTHAHEIAAAVIPPVDILNWLKLRHLVGESNPYPLFTLELLHNARKRKKRLNASFRQKRAERAKQSLAAKGVIIL